MYRNELQLESRPAQQNQVGTPQTYFVKHDFDGAAKLTTTVAHALADASGHDVTDVEATLYDAIDPDALELLFKPEDAERMNGHLNCAIGDYQITVYSNGQIAIATPH